jgi:predicted dehydrogenase
MGLKVGFCGVGAFANCFIPLFKAHPLVAEVVLADLDADKLQEKSAQFEVPRTLPSLDALCESDVDAVAIFSQNWMHGPQAAQALRAGKDVYSAVPAGITVAEIAELVAATQESGRIYMIGETSYYYPAAIYCRRRFRDGDFGRIVYSEGEYYHDFDHGLYDVLKWRGGDRWREIAGAPPMHYPTHSTGQVVSVINAHATHVSCFGFVDNHPDGLYRADVNQWGNTFSNETGLFHMTDGSMMRINEFRRIGHPGNEAISIYGTEGCYEQQANAQAWVTKTRGEIADLRELLAPTGAARRVEGQMDVLKDAQTHAGVSQVHDVNRLPVEFVGLPNGHVGSHQFLVDDFVKACAERVHPPCHVWEAARYVLPGLTAHESALRGGALLAIPDHGDCPHEVVYF